MRACGATCASLPSSTPSLLPPQLRPPHTGLCYLHAQRTVHRDVKGANLLVETSGRVKLADFGMAKQMVEQASFTKSFKGSAFWMARCLPGLCAWVGRGEGCSSGA